MKGANLAVVRFVSGLPQNTELACQAVWAKTTQFLQPNLGKLYSSFYPAANPWGIDLNVRFGVLLGREAPNSLSASSAPLRRRRTSPLTFTRRPC